MVLFIATTQFALPAKQASGKKPTPSTKRPGVAVNCVIRGPLSRAIGFGERQGQSRTRPVQSLWAFGVGPAFELDEHLTDLARGSRQPGVKAWG